ncbi:PIG-L deacetylase family protein [Clostridium perfringens]|uniref:PIG-L deacetylase family protein n=1 Tax=Clostridium perfringens TaxID=1502 RepID=UPI00103CF15A|nr:PIG-L family deacetylase [Clostridium perfringens]TBX05617.1 hypothetical protein BFS03_13445 [Clostridium perfringens]
MIKDSKNILVIFAHPDDMEIFMSGTIIKLKKNGYKIYCAIVSDGSKGGINKKDIVQIRRKEAIDSAKIIDINPIFLNLIDSEILYDKESYRLIVNLIDNIRPDIIFTHNPNDYHSDHRIVSNLVFDSASYKVPVIYVDSITGINFNPDFYIDITDEFSLKKKMIFKHKSQLKSSIYETTKCLNSFRGMQATGDLNRYAEAFKYSSKRNYIKIIERLKNIIINI